MNIKKGMLFLWVSPDGTLYLKEVIEIEEDYADVDATSSYSNGGINQFGGLVSPSELSLYEFVGMIRNAD